MIESAAGGGSEEPRRPRLRGGHENAWVIVPAGAAASIIS
jgi:hypothetical protein